MNINNFTRNLESIQTSLFKSEFLSETRRKSFTDDKLALLLTEIAKLAVQTALQLEELEQKERTLALNEEKTRQELEIAGVNAKYQAQIAIMEALKGLIQAHSMARASGDNATINKANAYNAFLNIVGNAENTDMVKEHAENVIKTINQINTAPLSEYDAFFKLLKAQAEELLNSIGGRDVLIFAPKLELECGETIKLMGISNYGDNPCQFEINGIVTEGKTTYLTAGEVGEMDVVFKALNHKREWISDNLKLKVSNTELQKLEWNKIYEY